MIDHWEDYIGEFLEKSGLYPALFSSSPVDSNLYFEDFVAEFSRKMDVVTYLLPLHGIVFPDTTIRFPGFSVKKLSSDELSTKVYSSSSQIGLNMSTLMAFVSNYWFLEVELETTSPKVGFLRRRFESNLLEANSYVPDEVMRALGLLSLLRWPDTAWASWFRFSRTGKCLAEMVPVDKPCFLGVPFALELRNGRSRLPSKLVGLISRLIDEDEVWGGTICDDLGNQIETPLRPRARFGHSATSDEIERLSVCFHRLERLRKSTSLVDCQFLDRAIQFLFAAATCHEWMQSFLQNVIVLETMFGAKDQVTASIARGIGHVYSQSETRGKGEVRYFKKIYDKRSKLIHGGLGAGHIDPTDALVTRVMARDSVEWTIGILTQIDAQLKTTTPGKQFIHRHFLSFLENPTNELALEKAVFG